MELPEIGFTIQSNEEIAATVSSWRSFSSLQMPGEGYIKVITITYIPPVTRNSVEIEEVPPNHVSPQILPVSAGNLNISRTLTSYIRQTLRLVIVDPDYAALTAYAVNSHQQRLMRIKIRGWVDYHRYYENTIRFQQWGRLTPRRINQPAVLGIKNNERAIEEAPIILAIEQHERAIEEAPIIEQQQPLTQEQLLRNIFEDDLQRRILHDLYKLQDKMDEWGAQVMGLLNIDRTNWRKNDRWRYNRYVVRPVSENWEAATRRYQNCVYSLPTYLQKKIIAKRREEVADF